MDNIIQIAHRGYVPICKARENTLFAFKNAIENNFDMIELDIQLCKSNEIIIYHDTHIPYNGKLTTLQKLTLDEIQQVNPYVITLEKFINTIDISENIKLYIDIKGITNMIIKPLIDLLYDNYSSFQNIILGSFNRNHLIELEKYNKDLTINDEYYINTGFITQNIFPIYDLMIILKNINYIITHWTMLDNDTITYCKTKKIKIYCYTVKNKDIIEYIKKFNIDGIVSDIKLTK